MLASVHAVVPPEAQFVRLNSLPYDHWAWALAGVEAGADRSRRCGVGAVRRRQARGMRCWAFTALFVSFHV